MSTTSFGTSRSSVTALSKPLNSPVTCTASSSVASNALARSWPSWAMVTAVRPVSRMPRKSTQLFANNSRNTGPPANSLFRPGHLSLFARRLRLLLVAPGIVKRSRITWNSTTVTIPSRLTPRRPTMVRAKALVARPVLHLEFLAATPVTAMGRSRTAMLAGRRSVGPQPHLARILLVPNVTAHRESSVICFHHLFLSYSVYIAFHGISIYRELLRNLSVFAKPWIPDL